MAENNRYDTALGVGAGVATYLAMKTFATKPYVNFARHHFKNFTEEENKIIKQGYTDAFEASGLKAKGVELIHLDNTNSEAFITKFAEKLDRLFTKISKALKIKKIGTKDVVEELKNNESFVNIIKTIQNGENAFYHPITKQIVVNENGLPFSVFHEIGHSLNHNNGGFTKFLHYGQNVSKAMIPAILITGLLKSKKEDGEQPKGIMDKTTTFIKNNCGKLVFAAMLPTIAEEGLASLNGAKLAKKVLDSNMLKKVNKTNAIAWGSYISLATVMGLGARLGVMVRDKIAQPEV